MAEQPRKKSPRAPTVSLSEALDRAMRIYDNERLHPAPVEVVAADMGYKSANNGSALSMIASLRYFGLLERPRDGALAVSKAVEQFRFSPSEEQKKNLLMQFLVTPPLYQELLAQYTTGLPSDGNLRYELIQRGFIPAAAENALQVFRQSVDFVGYYEANAPGSAQQPLQPLAEIGIGPDLPSGIQPDDVDSPRAEEAVRIASRDQQTTQDIDPSRMIADEQGLDRIPVRLSKGRRAWLIIPTPFYMADKARLKAQIDLLLAEDEDE